MAERPRPWVALSTDLLCVVVFCTIGRRSHAEQRGSLLNG
jgi:hypothetical protein